MKKIKPKEVAILIIGIGVIWWVMRPKEAKAEELPATTPKDTPTQTTPSALPPGWYVTEIVPLQKKLAQLKTDLNQMYQQFGVQPPII